MNYKSNGTVQGPSAIDTLFCLPGSNHSSELFWPAAPPPMEKAILLQMILKKSYFMAYVYIGVYVFKINPQFSFSNVSEVLKNSA